MIEQCPTYNHIAMNFIRFRDLWHKESEGEADLVTSGVRCGNEMSHRENGLMRDHSTHRNRWTCGIYANFLI